MQWAITKLFILILLDLNLWLEVQFLSQVVKIAPKTVHLSNFKLFNPNVAFLINFP